MHVLFHQVIEYIYAISTEAHRDIFIMSEGYFILYLLYLLYHRDILYYIIILFHFDFTLEAINIYMLL